jgi:hypothetical protein
MKGLGGFGRCFGVLALVGLTQGLPSIALEMDAGVKAEQAATLRQDLEYLGKVQYQDNQIDRDTAELMGIRSRLTGATLGAWLDARVSTILSEDLKLEESLLASRVKPVYPEPNVFPPRETPPAPKPGPQAPSGGKPGEPADDSKPKIVMSNLGAGLYMMGKQRSMLLALKRTDGKIIPVVSPRVGLIQIGEGLFFKKFQVNQEQVQAPANSISRLSTLFHEARHSDGHGVTLAFGHAFCPEGHAYAGYPACDKNLNGPYTIGAQVLKSLAQGCGDCSVREKTILTALEADSRSRILKLYTDSKGKAVKANRWSDRPERVTKVVQVK